MQRYVCRQFTVCLAQFQFVEFRDLTDWMEVKSRLEAVGPSLASSHLGAAFAQTQKLLPRPPSHFLDELSQKTLAHLHSMDTKTANMVFHSCAVMSYFDKQLLDGIANVVLEQIYFMDFKALAKMIYHLGLLQQSWNQTSTRPFPQFENLIKALTSRITFAYCTRYPLHLSHQNFQLVARMFDLKTCRLLMSGLTNLQYKEPMLLAHISRLIKHKTVHERLSKDDLVATLFSLSQLNHRDVALLRHLANEATRTMILPQFTNVEIASVIYSLSRLGIRGKNLMTTLFNEAAKRTQEYTNISLTNLLFAACTVPANSAIFEVLLQEALQQRRLSTYSTMDLVTVLHALTKHPARNPAQLAILADEMRKEKRLESFRSRDLCIALLAFVQNLYSPASSLASLIQLAQTEETVKELTSENLAVLVFSLGKLKLEVGTHVIEKLQTPFLQKTFTQNGIAKILDGLASASSEIPGLNMIYLEEALQPHRLTLYSSKELLLLLTVLTKLELITGKRKFVQKIEEQLTEENSFRSFELSTVAQIIIVLSELNRSSTVCFERLVAHLVQAPYLHRLETSTLCRLLLACSKLGYPANEVMPVVEELSRLERSETVQGALVEVTSALSKINYSGNLWKRCIAASQQQLQSNSLTVQSKLKLLQAFGSNLAVSKELVESHGILKSVYDSFLSPITTTLSLPQIEVLCCTLKMISYRHPSLLQELGDELNKRLDFKSLEFLQAFGCFLEACFHLDQFHELISQTKLHIELLHETLQMDSSFPVQRYLTPALVCEFLKLKTREGTIEDKLFGLCLDVLSSLERQSIRLEKQHLADIFLCFQYLPFQPSIAAHSRLLRRSMEASVEQQRLNCCDLEESSKLLKLLRESHPGCRPRGGTVLDDANVWIDVLLDREDRTVVLFLEAGVHVDFYSDYELGPMILKRAILERNGYKVLTVRKAHFEKMNVQEKKKWIEEFCFARLNE